MSGTAGFGTDYNLGGLSRSGQVTIPIGANAAAITLNALSDTASERSEGATMTLVTGTGYKLPSTKSARKTTVTIANGP